MTAALVIKGVTVEYSSGGYKVRPLHNFGLDMRAGEIGIVLGASGCGKSTLLSVIAGLLRPAAGSIRVGGTEVVGLVGRDLTRYRQSGVGIVFQAFNLVASLSARENIELVMLTAGVERSKARRRSEELLDSVDLSAEAARKPGQLSGGQQQRVAIARALALDPPVLLADEPTAHLDYIQVEAVLNILRRLADSNRTVLVATHDERLLPLADRVVELTPRRPPASAPGERRELADGEILFSQGDPGWHVYVVESGVIRLVRERVDGGVEVIGDVAEDGYFGELGPLFGMPRSAIAIAVGETVVNGLALSQFRERMQQRRQAGLPETQAEATLFGKASTEGGSAVVPGR
ncbi:MAG: ABC transporter ATP-binding protein [Acidimicrobiales bacterium]